MKKTALRCFALLSVVAMTVQCSSSSTTGDPKTIVGAISTAVQTVGTGMATSRGVNSSRPSASSCDVHGYPNGITQSDGNYPGYLTYCFTTVDSGDTVLGGFSTPNSLSCLISAAGLVYDGAAHSVTVTEAMLTDCELPSEDLPAGTVVSMTGSSPASFNSNYSNGVIVDLSDTLGLTFKIAFNVDGSKSSFITNESWTDGSIGTTGGKFDTATGNLWYESRVERENCSTASRCGWNRHTRINAALTMSGATPTGLSSLSFGYSNIQFTPAQSGLGGTLVTAKGNLTDGVKARLWSIAPSAVAEYNTAGNWTETANTKCYTSSSETASTCGTGLDKFSTNTKFLLHSTDGHTSVSDWLGAITGQTFTEVDMDSDTQF